MRSPLRQLKPETHAERPGLRLVWSSDTIRPRPDWRRKVRVHVEHWLLVALFGGAAANAAWLLFG